MVFILLLSILFSQTGAITVFATATDLIEEIVIEDEEVPKESVVIIATDSNAMRRELFSQTKSVRSIGELKAALSDKTVSAVILENDIVYNLTGSMNDPKLSLNHSIVIYGQGHTLDLGMWRINVASNSTGGNGLIKVEDLKMLTSNRSAAPTIENHQYGFFYMNKAGNWDIEFNNIEFNGSSIVSNTNTAYGSVTFQGNSTVTASGVVAREAVVFAKDILIKDNFTLRSSINNVIFKSPRATGNFTVGQNAQVDISRDFGISTLNVIENYQTYSFQQNSNFKAVAQTNRVYNIVVTECATAIIRSNAASEFTLENGANVELITDGADVATKKGFEALILGKHSSGLNMNIAENASLSATADGYGINARGYSAVSILGNGDSNINIKGRLNVTSNDGSAWYYQFGHSGKNHFTVDGTGNVNILAKNNDVVGAYEYAAFEAYGKCAMYINVKDGGKMSVISKGYRGMSLAASGSYAEKKITVSGDRSELFVQGSTWAIAAETQPTLTISALDGGKIKLSDTDYATSLCTPATSTVYSVGPTTYTVDGAGSEMNVVHLGGAYGPIFHDGYGPLVINVTNGGFMDVYNSNTGKDTSARRAAITAQSTTVCGKGRNLINVDGVGSKLQVINDNPYTHGNGGDTGLYPTGAISFNSTALGDINITNGGSLLAQSKSLAPTIQIHDGLIKIDNPGLVDIRNDSTSASPGKNTTYSTVGMAVFSSRYSHCSVPNFATALDVKDADVTVWSTFETPFSDAAIDNKWIDVTFKAKNKAETKMPKPGIGGDTNLALDIFSLSSYGRIAINGDSTGQIETPEPKAAKASKNMSRESEIGQVGDILRYTITAWNDKPNSIWTDVYVYDTIPAEVDFLAGTKVYLDGVEVYYRYNTASRLLVVSLGDISGGDIGGAGKVTRTLVFDVVVNELGYNTIIRNRAVVDSITKRELSFGNYRVEVSDNGQKIEGK